MPHPAAHRSYQRSHAVAARPRRLVFGDVSQPHSVGAVRAFAFEAGCRTAGEGPTAFTVESGAAKLLLLPIAAGVVIIERKRYVVASLPLRHDQAVAPWGH